MLVLFMLLIACADAQYHRLPQTDINPCLDPCLRVGNCGYDTPNPVCNITLIAELCDSTCGCVAFNSNGWLKGCGNTSCGVTFESTSTADTYIKGDGMPPAIPSPPVAPIDDVFYPPEEELEREVSVPKAVDGNDTFVSLQFEGEQPVRVPLGASANSFRFLAMLHGLQDSLVAVLERNFARWGFFLYLEVGGSEIARLRKGTGLRNFIMNNYSVLLAGDCLYDIRVRNDPHDWLAARIVNDTVAGEATYNAAIKYLSPQREYTIIGSPSRYQKYSVSPDGRIKSADRAIYTPDLNADDVGPGIIVWDLRNVMPKGWWPETNFTYMKSSLVGRYLRVVSTIAYNPSTNTSFEQIAFVPECDPVNIYIRILSREDTAILNYSYFNVTISQPATALSPEAFYTALYNEQRIWNETFSSATSYTIPGQEGARQVDTTLAAVVESLTLYVGLLPNYGDGEDYWSPGGSLPSEEIAVVQHLLDIGMSDLAASLLGWWLDHFINEDGSISDFDSTCPFNFSDAFADYGEMLDLFARVGRSQIAYNTINGSAWVAAHINQAIRLAQYSYNLRLIAKANSSTFGTPAQGLIWGNPEHDTCREPDYYYHNNAWFIRGLVEIGKFFRDLCPIFCPDYAEMGVVYLVEADAFLQDFLKSINLTATFDNVTGGLVFIPPIAEKGIAPFGSMVESILAMYSNFRYYSELLGADVLPLSWSIAVQIFRENTYGTVSGITRYSDHLDDMPSFYYLATSLRDDRLHRFFLLQYGHMANYMSRGTFTATEQIPIYADANGLARDYLWNYLEGGIDECVPSIMLSAFGTRWQFVFERYDQDMIWLAKGAPLRWADPRSKGYGIANASTRFGWVSFHFSSEIVADGQVVSASIAYTAMSSPSVPLAPAFAVRMRSSDPFARLSEVSVQGAISITSVDSDNYFVYLTITSQVHAGTPILFSLSALLLST